MNEFEWLRQWRGLNQPVAPRNDLWARIDAELDESARSDTPVSTPLRHTRASLRVWMAAASIAALVVLACGLTSRMHSVATTTSLAISNTPAKGLPWKTADPRLAGAAVELDAARMELQQAMQQAPDSPALQRLLQQTNAQQNRLREFEKQSG